MPFVMFGGRIGLAGKAAVYRAVSGEIDTTVILLKNCPSACINLTIILMCWCCNYKETQLDAFFQCEND